MSSPTTSTSETVTTALRDAAYVVIGLGVITFQKAQVRRQELTRAASAAVTDARARLDGATGTLGEAVEDRVKLVEERLETIEDRVDAVLDDLAGRLPEQAQDVVAQAREQARRARGQVQSIVTRAS